MKIHFPDQTDELLQSVVETLRQGEQLLKGINNETYTHKVPAAFNASIGCHYRHCLDHFRTLLDSAVQGDLNYDHRERGTVVERDRSAALAATCELRHSYEFLGVDLLARSLVVTCKTSYTVSGSQVAPSTVGREVMYSVAHAVHHFALIRIMAHIQGVILPESFGVAPSTLKHQAGTAVAA